MTDVDNIELERQASRRFGCGVLLLAPVVFAVVFLGAFGGQALFFTADDYVRGPKATSEMPAFVTMVLAGVTMIGGMTGIASPLLAAALGIALLITGRNGSSLTRVALLLLPVPVLMLTIHLVVLLAFYVWSQGRWPKASGEVLPAVLGAYGVALVWISIMWWRVRRRWPQWSSSRPAA